MSVLSDPKSQPPKESQRGRLTPVVALACVLVSLGAVGLPAEQPRGIATVPGEWETRFMRRVGRSRRLSCPLPAAALAG